MKTSFKDALGRTWTFQLDIGTIRYVKLESGVFLPELLQPDSGLVEKLANDPVALYDVIVAALRNQLDDKRIDERQFAEALNNADIVSSAFDALMEAIVDFSPAETRETVRTALGKVTTATRAAEKEALARLRKAVDSPEFDSKIQRTAKEHFGLLSTNAPASPESSPGDTPSET